MKKAFFLVPLFISNLFVFAQKSQKNKDVDNAEKIFTTIDSVPEFPGGMPALISYLSSNIKYPENARSNNIQGKVVVKFVVCKDGSLCDETIIKSVDSSMDKEVIRVVKAMPKWKPGKQKGEAVKVYYTLPVTFKLQGQEKDTLPDTRDYLLKNDNPKSNEATQGLIYDAVEQIPEFPGGMTALQRFLALNIRFPEEAKKKDIQGRVILRFVVNADGSISNIETQINPGGGLAEEGIRVIKIMPLWKPGTMGGKPVRVYYTLPITFKLAK